MKDSWHKTKDVTNIVYSFNYFSFNSILKKAVLGDPEGSLPADCYSFKTFFQPHGNSN